MDFIAGITSHNRSNIVVLNIKVLKKFETCIRKLE